MVISVPVDSIYYIIQIKYCQITQNLDNGSIEGNFYLTFFWGLSLRFYGSSLRICGSVFTTADCRFVRKL